MALASIPRRASASLITLLAIASLTGCVHRLPQDYTGRWVLRTADSNLMLLHTEVHGAHLRGELTRPQHFTEEPDGSFLDVRSPIVTRSLVGARHGRTIGVQVGVAAAADHGNLFLHDRDHIDLDFFQGAVPAWTFQRIGGEEQVVLKTDWPPVNQDPHIAELAHRLQAEADRDKAARSRDRLDDAEMVRLSAAALPLLNEIFSTYGWPTASQFGAEAEANFWLLVQHQELATQKQMLASLQAAVSAGEAPQDQYAYLFDRVQVAEGKAQHWGTQSRCQEGHAILYPLDASTQQVNDRRRKLGLGVLDGAASEQLCKRSR